MQNLKLIFSPGGGHGSGDGHHHDDDHEYGHGDGLGNGRGLGRGGGRGRNRGGGFGPGGFCVCAKCGEKVQHQQGTKCTELKCPKCGHTMVREELLKK